jgi:hypothetical protein
MYKFAYDRKTQNIYVNRLKVLWENEKKKTWLLDIKKSEWNLNKGN